MKNKTLFFVWAQITSTVNAGTINVPGDFPGDFQMDLLNGFAVMDFDPSFGGGFIHEMTLDTSNNSIQFSAGAFDGIGTGAGSSVLSVDPVSMIIGTGEFFGLPITFYIDGGGLGVLDDIDGTQGHWAIDVPLYADWNGNTFEYTGFSLSSDATYEYDSLTGSTTAIGQAMDYSTGDAYLVGQGVNLDLSSGVYGTRITLGILGNDPVIQSVVPVPPAVWLFGSGIIGLIGFARRRAS